MKCPKCGSKGDQDIQSGAWYCTNRNCLNAYFGIQENPDEGP